LYCKDDTLDRMRTWHSYIQTGKIDSATIRCEVAESWARCKEAGVNPLTNGRRYNLRGSQLEKVRERRRNMIDIASTFMENLYRFVSNSKFVVLLSDEHGIILETVGDSAIIAGSPELCFEQGASWAEEEVGTNGVGTTLVLKKPFQVSGADHFCRIHHAWTCSGAPIFDDNQKLIGILEVSGPVEETHQHTLGMVVAAVEAIHHQLQNLEKNRQLELLNNRLNNIFLTVSDGVIVVDLQGIISQVNPVAEAILERRQDDIKGDSITGIFQQCEPVRKVLTEGKSFCDLELNVQSRSGTIHTVTSGKPVKDSQGNVSGGVIFINLIKNIKKLVNRFNGSEATFRFRDIVGKSKPMLKAIRLAKLAAENDSNVLLFGESGTGKEIFAQSIHNRSARRSGPFIAVNCGAIPRELVGSELFGYVEGAFTGARKGGRPGKFELAAGGTLFLDEIGDMPLDQQVSLLRVIQDKRITRIGGDNSILMDVRIICATNKNLLSEITKGNFRQDIYYRLNVINISLPPLRERQDDIELMFNVFFTHACKKMKTPVPELNPQIFTYLQMYDWPGNAREFQNIIERIVNIANGDYVGIEHLPEEILASVRTRARGEKAKRRNNLTFTGEINEIKEKLAEKERQAILDLLKENNGNVSQVARDMGISRNSLYRKLKKLSMTE
jgi:sigma-54 dependent transcriptional regulator, acetoin dehydrogenase operon transcriptional activator AcoR